MSTENNKIKSVLIFLLFFAFQLFVCICFEQQKVMFFTDEVHTYSLANNKLGFLHSPSGWFPSKFYEEQMTDKKQDIFNFQPAYDNQIKDVHPPLYYYLIHIFSSFSGDRLSKWTGVALNFVILFFVDILFLKLSYFLVDRQKNTLITYLPLALWSFCSAGISNILLIRMYLLLTLWILLYIFIHIRLLDFSKKTPCLPFVFLGLNFIAGGLTHYYFYVFAFSFSFVVCIFMLIKKEYKKLFLYIGVLLFALGFNTCYYPTTWLHIFSGYRGVEVLSNLLDESRNNIYVNYFNFINKSFSGGALPFIIGILAVLTVYKHIHIKGSVIELNFSFQRKNNELIYWSMIFATLVFFFIATKGLLLYNRYLYPIYPIFAIVFINILYYTFNELQIPKKLFAVLSILLVISMCYLSVKRYKIEYHYRDYAEVLERIENVKGSDCLFYINNHRYNRLTGLPLLFNYDELYFYNNGNGEDVREIVKKRKTDSPLLVALPQDMKKEEYLVVFKELKKDGYNSIYLYSMPYTDIHSYDVWQMIKE